MESLAFILPLILTLDAPSVSKKLKKNNWNFYFFVAAQEVLCTRLQPHKTFWGTAKKVKIII